MGDQEEIITFRTACADDAQALAQIYAPYVETSVTFEYEAPTTDQFRDRILERVPMYPYIVCEANGTPVGYAYASRLFDRAAYAWSVELSVYLADAARGHRIGSRLYSKILSVLELQGIRSVIGKVTHPNVPSERLHRALGFVNVGTYRTIGFKLGEWRDVHIYEKLIGDFDIEPEPVIPFVDLDAADVQAIYDRTLEEDSNASTERPEFATHELSDLG